MVQLKNNRLLKLGLSIALFVGSMAAACYFIMGAAKIYLHTDSADTLLWAQAAYDAKALLNPDFYYATALPLGGHLLMVPFIAMFGVGLQAQTWGMLVFFILLVAAMIFCLRSAGLQYEHTLLISSLMIMMTLVSDMTKTMFYMHILYYSQGFLYLLVGLGLLFRAIKANTAKQRKKAGILLVLLAVWCMLTAVNGEMTLAIFTVPLLGAYVLERLLSPAPYDLRSNETKKIWLTVALLSLSTLVGLMIRALLLKDIRTPYADGITTFAQKEVWTQQLGNLLPFWLSITTTQLVQPKVMSASGIINVMQILASLTFVIVPLVAVIRYRTLSQRWERLVILVHWVTTGVILFLQIFVRYGEADWRLMPVFMTGVLATGVYLRHALINAAPPWRRMAAVALALLFANAAWIGYFTAKLPTDIKKTNAYGLIAFLKEHDLTDGYASYWNSIAPTVHANEEIRIRQVNIGGSEIIPQQYQSNRNWYSQQLDRCFLLLTKVEYDQYGKTIPADYTEALRYGQDYVFVYDYNIIR